MGTISQCGELDLSYGFELVPRWGGKMRNVRLRRGYGATGFAHLSDASENWR